MKIGYPCLNRTLGVRTDLTFRLASYTPARFRETVQRNLDGLRQTLDYNVRNQLRFFRISSMTIPFGGHPICRVHWASEFRKELQELGRYIREHELRISMHPDQFVLINALDPAIIKRSVADLAWHAQFLDAMGLGPEAKIQIHVGGIYGDKEAAMQRFAKEYKRLSEPIRRRLVIENDDHLFSLADCLKIHRMTGVPILFDSFHHECLHKGEPLGKAIAAAQKTWKKLDGPLMMDYSSQKAGARKGCHAESLDENDFRKFIASSEGLVFDVMLEIKDKEPSALKALAIARAAGRIS